MTIRELIEQFDIQGTYCIKAWNDDDYVILAEGMDFECEYYDINDETLDRKITYMFALNNVLIIEVEL